MSERETKELVTPNGHKVVVFDHINGGELRKVQRLFVEDMSASDVTPSNDSTPLDKIKAGTMFEAQELTVRLLVVSVDGKTGDGWELVANLNPEDTDFVITELDKYVTAAEGKKKSS